MEALQQANQASGGSVVEMAETEYMVRSRGFLKSLDDFRAIPLSVSGATPVMLRDVAFVQIGPEMRRGIAELNGEGEVAGGVVVMRSGKNARTTIRAVKAKLETLKASLPAGVEVVPTYDRSLLIDRAVDNLRDKLIEEFIVVALVCALFLFHLRSAFVAVVTLPVGVLAAFVVMHWQGVSANILSLGGIAIALGAMVDAAVVLIENAHKHLETFEHEHRRQPTVAERWSLVTQAAEEVGPALFFSLLVITLSFVPVFTLEAQEGRLFSPLAFTKTYAMAAAAGLSVTLVPVLMGYLIRGRIPAREQQPPQPVPDGRVPAAAGGGAALPEGDAGRRGGAPGADGHSGLPPRRRVPAGARRGRPAVHAVGAAGTVRVQGDGTAAADRPAHQDRAGGRARVRQGRPRRHGDRPGAAGDVRDDHPVQAARPVAAGDDAGQAGRGTGPHGQGAGPVEHLGAADPQPHRHAGHGHQEPGGHQGGRPRPGDHRPARGTDRGRREGRSRGVVGAGRAPDGRPLHRRRRRPAGGGPLRPVGGRRSGRRLDGHRRRQRRRGRPGARALPHQRALPARDPRLAREAARSCRSSPAAAPRCCCRTWHG